MNDSLRNMLNTIAQISKNTQNFNELAQLLPLLNELRKADLDNKQINEYLKLIGELFPKLKTKIQAKNRAESMFEVYGRMTNQINLELSKLVADFQEVSINPAKIESEMEQHIKAEASALIKQIEETLVANRKNVISYINTKRKEYFNENDTNHYLNKALVDKVKENNQIRTKIQACKYQFGQYRCEYNLYYSKIQNPEQQKLKNAKQTGMSEDSITKLQKKVILQKRKDFVLKSCQHVERQYHFVISNLKKVDKLNSLGNYQQNIYIHFLNWAQRLKIMIQTVLISLANFERNKMSIRQQQSFLQLVRQLQQKFQSYLFELSNVVK